MVFLKFCMTKCYFKKTPFYTDFFFTGYSIYLRGGAFLDYDTAREYLMTIDCTDTKDTVSSTFVVYVAKNEPPVITNLPASKIIIFFVCKLSRIQI